MTAVKERRFYVFSHPGEMHNIQVRTDDQLQGRELTDPFAWMPGVTPFLKQALRSG
jgi:hypothetical protein